jgi:hypothetical protein
MIKAVALLFGTLLLACHAQISTTTLWTANFPANFGAPFVESSFSTRSGLVAYFVLDVRSHGRVVAINGTSGATVYAKGIVPKVGINAQATFLELLRDDAAGAVAIVGCTNSVLLFDVERGAVLSESELPPGIALTVDNNASSTPHHVLVGTDLVVLGVEALGDSVFGTTVFNLSSSTFTRDDTFAQCANTTNLAAAAALPGELLSYVQACNDGTVLLVSPSTLSPIWTFKNDSLSITKISQVVITADTTGTPLSIILVLQVDAQYPAVAAVSPTSGMQQWFRNIRNKCLDQSFFTLISDLQLASSFGKTLDTAVANMGCQITALDVRSGEVRWNSATTFGFNFNLFVDSRDQRFVYALTAYGGSGYATFVKFKAASGSIACQCESGMYYSEGSGTQVAYRAVASESISVQLNATRPQVTTGNPSIALLFVSGIASFDAATCAIQMQNTYVSVATSSPLILVSGTDSVLVYFSSETESSGIVGVSLSTGFFLPGVTSMTLQGSVLFAVVNDVVLSAFNQIGQSLWKTPIAQAPLTPIPVAPVGNFALVQTSEFSLAVVDSLTGALINSVTISSDCHENTTLTPMPKISPVGTGLVGRDAYFAAGLQCLFHVTASRTMTQIRIPTVVSSQPVVDEDNGVVFVLSTTTVYAFSTSSDELLWSYTNSLQGIASLVASAAFGDVSRYGERLNRYVFVFTATDVVCFDSLAGTRLWSYTLPAPPISELTSIVYNASLFVATTTGVCRLSTALSVPSAARLLWCSNTPMNSVTSNMIISPTARIFAVVDQQTLLVISAASGQLLANTSLASTDLASCATLVFNRDNYIVYAVCSEEYIAVDAVSLQPIFSFPSAGLDSISYFNGVVYALATSPEGVSAVPTPIRYSMLNRNPEPQPAPLSPSLPETIPPGFVPGTPIPTSPPSPNPSSPVIPAVVMGNVAVNDGASSPSGFSFPSPEFSDLVFSVAENVVRESKTVCTPTARNVTDFSLVWSGNINFVDENCSCADPFGLITPTNEVIVICTGVMAAYQFPSGQLLWTTDGDNISYYLTATYYSDPQNATRRLIIALMTFTTENILTVVGFDVATGKVVWSRLTDFDDGYSGQLVLFTPSPSSPAATAVLWETSDSSGVVGIDVLTGKTVFSIFDTPICTTAYFEVAQQPNSNYALSVSGLLSLYVGCVNGTSSVMALYSVNVLTGALEVEMTLDVASEAASTTNMLLDQQIIFIGIGNSLIAVDLTKKTVVWNTSFADSSIEMEAACGLLNATLLCAASNSSEGYVILAVDKHSGTVLWNSSIPGTGTQNSSRLAVQGLGNSHILVGTAGAYLLDAATGALAWGAAYEEVSQIGGFVVAPASANFAVPGSAPGSLVYSVALLTQSSVAFMTRRVVTTVPWNTTHHNGVTLAAAYASQAAGHAFGSWILSGTTLQRTDSSGRTTTTVYLPSNTVVLPEIMTVVPVYFRAGRLNVSVLLVFYPTFVRCYEADTGSFISSIRFADMCTSPSATFSVQNPTAVGQYVFFQDTYCFYRIDAYSGDARAVAIGTPNGIMCAALFSQDQSVAVVAVNFGTLWAIDTMNMSLRWYSDVADRLVAGTKSMTLLPSEPFRVLSAPGDGLPPTEEYFLSVIQSFGFAFRFSNGDLLWLTKMTPSGEYSIANSTSDGGLLVATSTNLTKYATSINWTTSSRVLWEVPIPSNSYYSYWMTQLGNSNVVIIVFYYTAVAFDLRNGKQLWSVPVSQAGVSAAQPLLVFDADRSAALPAMVGIAGSTMMLLSPTTGTEIYSIAFEASMFAAIGNFVTLSSSPGAVATQPLVFDRSVPLPSPAVPGSNTVPAKYSFATPQPTTSPAVSNPVNKFLFSPLQIWNIPSLSNDQSAGAGYAINYSSVPAFLATHDFYDPMTETYNTSVIIVDAKRGDVLFSRNISIPGAFSSTVTWTAVAGTSLLGYVAGFLFALDMTSPQLPLLFTMALDAAPLGPSFQGSILSISSHGVFCAVYYSSDVGEYSSSCRQLADGTELFKLPCSQEPQLPLFDLTAGLVVMQCPPGELVAAFNIASRQRVWSSTILQQQFLVLTNDALIAAGFDNMTATFTTLSIETGSVSANRTFAVDEVEPTMTQFAAIGSDRALVLVYEVGLYCFSLATGAIVWEYAALEGVAFDTAVDPLTSQPAVYLFDGVAGFVGIDLNTGAKLFSLPVEDSEVEPSDDTYSLTASFSPYLLLIQSPSGIMIAADLEKRELRWTVETSSVPYFLSTPYGKVLAASRSDGGLSGYLLGMSAYSASAFFSEALVVPSKPLAASSTLFAQTLFGLYAVDMSTGGLNWGVMLDLQSDSSSSASSSSPFSPIFTPIFVPSTGPTSADMVLFSTGGLQVTVVTLSSGAVQFTKHLPYCATQGTGVMEASQTFGGVADGGFALLTIGNMCLYAVNTDTHDIVTLKLPSMISTAGPPVVTGSCVVVADQFGSIFCFPRPSLSVSTGRLDASPAWQYSTGYSGTLLAMQPYGSQLLISHGQTLHALSLRDNGQLVFRIDVGSDIVFVPFGNVVVAASNLGVYGIALDPQATNRVLWSTLYADLHVTHYYSGLVVTYDALAVFLVEDGFVAVEILGPEAGSVVYNQSTADYGVPLAIAYSNAADDLKHVFAVALQEHVVVADASTGDEILTIESISGQNTGVLLDGASGSLVTFSNAVSVNALPLLFVQHVTMDDPSTPAPTLPSPNGTLPAGFVPQGRFTGIPSLPPGVMLPNVGCIINIEALYNGLVTCVNSALTSIYTDTSENSVQCGHGAELVAACAQAWITSTQRACPASFVYLSDVLSRLNSSEAFNFCGHPIRCADGIPGSMAVCQAVALGQQAASGATIYPSFAFPKPANQLPQFTLPANTGSPQPTNAPQPAVNYEFTCLLSLVFSDIPAGFEERLQQLLGLPLVPSIELLSSATSDFSFIFGIDAAAAALSEQLQVLVVNEYTAVITTLEIRAISFRPYVAPAGPAAKGLSPGAISGIATGATVAVLLALFAVYRYRKSSSEMYFHPALNSGGLSAENMRSLPKAELESIGTKYGAL